MAPKKSDHHNGKTFFNPTLSRDSRLIDGLKFMIGRRMQPWPSQVKNAPRIRGEAPQVKDQALITFINHSSILIQTHSLCLLTDPVFSNRVSPVPWAGPKRARAPGLDFDELPKVDLVLISHNHYDHLDLDTLKKLEKKFRPQFLVAWGDRQLLMKNGIKNVHEMDWWDDFSMPKGDRLTFVPTQHFSARGILDRNQSLWGGYNIQSAQLNIHFGGDAAYSSHYAEIRRRLGPVDIALLPIGAYEPRWFMKAMHMNPAEAVQAHLDLESKQSIGIHFGTFQLTEEAIDQPKMDLSDALKARNISPNTFICLHEGESRLFTKSP